MGGFSMENNGKMTGSRQEEEIELDLGLSIGCSFKNPEKPNSIKNETVQPQHRIDARTSSFEVDPQVKREIEALRRQETKRKRQEKQHKKINGTDNKLPDLDTKRCEFDVKEGECKRSRGEGNSKTEMQNVNLNFTVEQNINLNKTSAFSCNQKGYSSTLYQCPALRYVPFTNGLQNPCLPCLASGGGAGGLLDEPGLHAVNGCVNSDENRRSASNGSPVCSSSLVSDYRSSSYEGGGSSDARSHSSHSLPEQRPLHGSRANDTNDQFEYSASSHSRETAQVYDKTTNCTGNCIKQKTQCDTAQFIPITKCTTNTVDQQTIPSNIVQFRPTKPKEDQQPVSSESQVSTSVNPSLKESKRDTGKPPKPQSQNQIIHCLQQMPCVSTTGNGPNGKTINGFLYRYTKTELSIICVCHGTSFSPAEFVQHAGGTEVSHPLRHITVIPSTF